MARRLSHDKWDISRSRACKFWKIHKRRSFSFSFLLLLKIQTLQLEEALFDHEVSFRMETIHEKSARSKISRPYQPCFVPLHLNTLDKQLSCLSHSYLRFLSLAAKANSNSPHVFQLRLYKHFFPVNKSSKADSL